MQKHTRFTVPLTRSALSSFPAIRSRISLTTVVVSGALALLGCEENYITNNYYEKDDAGTVAVPSADAAVSDGGSTGETTSDTDPDSGATPTDTDTDENTDTDTDDNTDTDTAEPADDAGTVEPSDDGGVGPVVPDAGGDAGLPGPNLEGAPTVNTPVAEMQVDVFGTVGNRYWFAADPAQVERMNNGDANQCDIWGCPGDVIYEPGDQGQPDDKTFVDNFFITTPDGSTADYGKLAVRLVGQSTRQPWTERTIPNLRLDMDHFTQGLKLEGYEHLRFNNGQVGNIFREALTLQIYRELDYPAPNATFAWVGSNVWGPDVWIPYTLVEVYKKSFCNRRAEAFGGSCLNMWEFASDLGWGDVLSDPANCQSDECDSPRGLEFQSAVQYTPQGPGFKEALAEYIDWDSFHKFQCLSWILETGDDMVHGGNNTLLTEGEDGKFRFHPYSVDISLNQEWYQNVDLYGGTVIPTGCQQDEVCWADTIAMCETMIEQFTALDPVGMLDDEYAVLLEAGMLRSGDEGRYEGMKTYLEKRLENLPSMLDTFRGPPPANCEYPNVNCGGVCIPEWDCPQNCLPPVGGPEPQPEPLPIPGPRPIPIDLVANGEFEPAAVGDAGADAGEVNDDGGIIVDPPQCPAIINYGVAPDAPVGIAK